MTTNQPQDEGGLQTLLFLVTFIRNEETSEMFNLTNLCHVIVKVEATELKVG
jgi:hypothetical protein